MNHSWKPHEIKYLEENFPTTTKSEIQKGLFKLNVARGREVFRSPESICAKASFLGLRKTKEHLEKVKLENRKTLAAEYAKSELRAKLARERLDLVSSTELSKINKNYGQRANKW